MTRAVTIRSLRSLAGVAALAGLAGLAAVCGAGCGGGAGSGADAKSAGGGAGAGDAAGASIGELAAAQGGLAALGGAGNREEGATGIEVAMGGGALRADAIDRKSRVKLDGVLKEWPDRAAASETISGSTGGLSLAVAVQYDDARLYLGGEVSDPKLARTSQHAEHDDHLVFLVAFPSSRGALAAYAVGVWAGVPGESEGAVKWLSGPSKGREVAGAKIVEANAGKSGFTFEAELPWSSFAEARTTRVGLRGAVQYVDSDAGGVHGVLATGKGSVERPEELPPLPTAPEQAVVENLLQSNHLASTAPSIDVFADVAGDERKERISVFGKLFTICGPGYRGGKQFFWRALTGKMVSLETRDFTGDGKADLLVRRRVAVQGTVPDVRHEVFELWSVPSGDEPVTLLAHEIAIATKDGTKRVSDAVRVSDKELEISVEPARGWDAASFHEQVASDVTPILLPWGPIASRTFRLEKGKLVVASETPSSNAAAGAGAGARAGSGAQASTRLPAEPPTPRVSKSTDLSRQVLDAYLKDQGLPATTRPRIDFEVHVDGDARPERVLLVGKDIVVFGPGFKNGTGYARITLSQFADDKDIAEMTARDLTGDGAAELVVRGVRHVATKPDGKVDVDALFIYHVERGGSIARVFAVETGRELAKNRVQGLVQFVPSKSGKGFDVDVRPGIAKGWTASTYPWPEDKPGGSIEPLLLPWGKTKDLRYSWNGSQFATAP
jgi:hypothetical protein